MSRLHRRVLGELLGDQFDTLLLPRQFLSGPAAVRAVASGRIEVPGVDPFQRVAEPKIAPANELAGTLDLGPANIFCHARVNRDFEHHRWPPRRIDPATDRSPEGIVSGKTGKSERNRKCAALFSKIKLGACLRHLSEKIQFNRCHILR